MHEIKGQLQGQSLTSKNMDLWNNAAGRRMGEYSSGSADSARRVKNALANDSLITEPKTDPRKHSSTPPYPNDNDPEVCCEECGAANSIPPIPLPPSPNEAYLEDGEQFIIPPMTVPPFNLPVVAVASRMGLADESQSEPTTLAESPVELTVSATAQVEMATWAEPLQASIDSAMAVIVETRIDVSQVPTLSSSSIFAVKA